MPCHLPCVNDIDYMFSGRRYVRYSNVDSDIDPDYPNWIDKNWMPFPRG